VLAFLDHEHSLTLKEMKPALEAESVECLLDEFGLWKEHLLKFELTLSRKALLSLPAFQV
jgi:hypothetical protein